MIGPLLKREIETTFQVVPAKSTAEELVFLCPECGDKSGHRAVNLKTGKTFCWRCNKGKNNKGYFLAWAKALGFHFTATEGFTDAPLAELMEEPEPESIVPVLKEVKLPKGFTPIRRTPKHVYTKFIVSMAERKNLTYEDFVEAGVGYTMDDPYWEPYAIFPVYDYGVCAYYQGRTYADVPGEPTKRFPSRQHVPFGSTYWIYNIDAVRKTMPDTVVVVESILNVLSLRWKLRELGWNNVVPVCVFKHHISRVQAEKLVRCRGLKEICLLFDHDVIDKTWLSVADLSTRMKLTIAEMPLIDGNKKCDANDDVEAAIGAIEARKMYTPAAASGARLKEPPVFDVSSLPAIEP